MKVFVSMENVKKGQILKWTFIKLRWWAEKKFQGGDWINSEEKREKFKHAWMDI